MLSIKEMTPEQRAVLRACEERYGAVSQQNNPEPVPPPPVYAKVWEDANEESAYLLEIQADGTTRSFMPGYMGVPIRLYGVGKRLDIGVPKHAEKYLDEEKSRVET